MAVLFTAGAARWARRGSIASMPSAPCPRGFRPRIRITEQGEGWWSPIGAIRKFGQASMRTLWPAAGLARNFSPRDDWGWDHGRAGRILGRSFRELRSGTYRRGWSMKRPVSKNYSPQGGNAMLEIRRSSRFAAEPGFAHQIGPKSEGPGGAIPWVSPGSQGQGRDAAGWFGFGTAGSLSGRWKAEPAL